MRFVILSRLPLLAALLALPSAALAQFELTVEPERLDGAGFLFFDNDQGMNNQLEFDADGPTITARGQVQGNAGLDVVTITWEMGFPNSASARDLGADASQDKQVLVGVNVNFDEGTDYFGQAAPRNCRASAKITGEGPNRSQAAVSCELGADLRELDDDDTPATPGDPPQAALDAIEAAFAGRKDVKIQLGNGKLSIKHKGGSAL
jgi:hypothetical protein